jgi:hypothetical protein
LFKVKAFAECGPVEVDYRNEFVAKAFLGGAFSDADFEVGSGLVKVADKVQGAR